MSRLTVNEAGCSGYTDEIILTPGDFTAAAGNSTTQVNVPVKEGDLIYGVAVEVTEAFSVDTDLSVGVDANLNSLAAAASALINPQAVESLGVSTNTGAELESGVGTVIAEGDGNIEITAGAALDGATSGKLRVLLGIRRINA